MRRAACRLAVYLALYGAVVLVSLTGDCLLRLARPTAPVLQYGIAASDSTVHGLIGGLSWAMLAVLQLTELATLPSSLSSLSSLSSSSLSFSPTPSPSPSAAYKSAQPVSSAVREYLSVAALRDTLLCALLSAAIDLDHLLAARSFSIQRLTTLRRRPVLHNTSLLLSISTAAFLLGHLLSLLTDINFFGTDKTLAKSSSSSSMSWATRFGYLLLMATLTHHLRDGLRRGLNLWPVPVRGGSSSCCCATPPLPLWLYFALLLILPLVLHLVATYHGGGHGPFGYAVVTTTTADSISSPFGGFRYSRLDADAPPTAETVV